MPSQDFNQATLTIIEDGQEQFIFALKVPIEGLIRESCLLHDLTDPGIGSLGPLHHSNPGLNEPPDLIGVRLISLLEGALHGPMRHRTAHHWCLVEIGAPVRHWSVTIIQSPSKRKRSGGHGPNWLREHGSVTRVLTDVEPRSANGLSLAGVWPREGPLCDLKGWNNVLV